MAILLDASQIMVANLMVELTRGDGSYDDGMLRHMILNSIRAIRRKFKDEYGEIVICVDDSNYWRKSAFPYYKAARKKAKEKSLIDWNAVYKSINAMKDDLDKFFPYQYISVENAEADDIIGTIIHHKGQVLDTGEPILIVSGDRDYFQLHGYGNVKQYDPVKKRLLSETNPDRYLFEHILRGDPGDGIPNILSPDNALVIGERQKPITKKRIEQWDYSTDFMKENELRGYKRNEMLIDLKHVPKGIQARAIEIYESENTRDRSKLFDYFMRNRLKNLTENITEF